MKLAVIAAVGLVATAAYAGGLPDADEADGRELRTSDYGLAEDDGARARRAAWVRRMRRKFMAMMRRKRAERRARRAARRQARRARRNPGRGRRGGPAPCSGRQTGQTVRRTRWGSVTRRFEQCADGSRQLVTETRRANNDRWMTVSTDRRWRRGRRQRTTRRVPYTPCPALDKDDSSSDTAPGSDSRRQSPEQKFGKCQFGATRLSCGRCACDRRKFKTWNVDGVTVCMPHGGPNPRGECQDGKLPDVTAGGACVCPKGRSCEPAPADDGRKTDPRTAEEKFGPCQFGAVRLNCGRCACDRRKFKAWRIDGITVCTPPGWGDPREGCSGGKLADVTNTLERCTCPKGRTCTDEPAVDPTVVPVDPTVVPSDPSSGDDDPAEPAEPTVVVPVDPTAPSDPSSDDDGPAVEPADPTVVVPSDPSSEDDGPTEPTVGPTDPAAPTDPTTPTDPTEPPVVVDPRVHPDHPVTPGPEVDRSKMRMAGKVEFEAFVAQNRIRTHPREFVDDVQAEIEAFVDDRRMRQADGVFLRTNEGIGAWREAKASLEQQPTFAPFEWNDYLALAAQDHCRDQSGSGATGHGGSDGSSPFDRMERYGRWEGSAAENIAYGRGSGEAFMLQLYIDDGVANRGHRKTMLSPTLRLVGLAHCPHARFGNEIVAAYAVGFTPSAAGDRALEKRAPK